MKKKYDVIIVGAGPAGLMCAYELIEKNQELKVILIDKGKDIYKSDPHPRELLLSDFDSRILRVEG